MTPRKSLKKLLKQVSKRLDKLDQIASQKIISNIQVSFICIEALNTWSNFLRAYYLSSLIQARSISGVTLTSSFTGTFDQALLIALDAYNPVKAKRLGGRPISRRDEPPWHDIAVVNKALNDPRINSSALNGYSAGVSINSRVFYDLVVFRNYFAHRNQETASRAVSLAAHYGIRSNQKPHEILLDFPLGKSKRLIVDWLDDLKLAAHIMCS